MRISRYLIKSISSLLVLVFLGALTLSFASCSSSKNEFPSFSNPDSSANSEQGNTTSSVNTNSNDGIMQLTVALPYSTSTVSYLARFYYAKENGLLGENETGATVSLDYLDSIDLPFVINSIQTSADGASIDAITSWDEDGDIPDLFLTDDFDSVVDSGLCVPLNDYLSGSEYINAGSVYINSLDEVTRDGSLFGVPHCMSVMLIMGNADYIPQSQNASFSCSLSDLDNYVHLIGNEFGFSSGDDEDSASFVPFSRAYELLPYIGGNFIDDISDSNIGTNANGVNSFMSEALYLTNPDEAATLCDDSVDFVQTLYDDDLSENSSNAGTDNVYARQAALWIASSSEMSLWSEYYPDNLYFLEIPTSNDGNNRIFSTLYPICISEDSDCPSLASDFAAFISFDTDSLLLLNRLEKREGYLPVVSTAAVWDDINSDDVFGYASSMLEGSISNCIFTPRTYDSELNDSIEEYISSYATAVLSDTDNQNEDYDFNLDECYGR